MFIYPNINPIAIKIGNLKIYWYGIIYALSILAIWGLALYRANKPNSDWNKEQISDLIFYCAIGAVAGGRIGFMLFYNLPDFLADPLTIFKVWEGGMSFHGGVIGVVLSLLAFAKRYKRDFFSLSDFLVPLIPLGLAAGRIGNFINGELWGKITTMPWGMIYPQAGPFPRHPSELYESLFEGALLFVILWLYSAKPRPRMAISALFLLLYGIARFSLEFFRQPDPQLGYIAFGWLTMGQLLSIPMIIVGLGMLYKTYKNMEKSNET